MVELLVAMAAGMTVALGAFAFARAATRSFQQETRLANATAATTLGFRRLAADIQRASFLSTPNIQREFRWKGDICEDPTAQPNAFRDLTGLVIEQSGSYPGGGSTAVAEAANKVAPDRLTITGSFDSTEMFFVKSIDTAGGNSVVVYLQQNSGAVSRALQPDATGTPSLGTSVQVGRIGRIIDQAGFHHYGVITGVAVNAGAAPQITMGGSPQIAVQNVPYAGNKGGCPGITGLGVSPLFNVVNRIRYEVRDLRADAAYAALYPNPPPVATDDAVSNPARSRHELVRTEIGVDDAPIGPNEVVAEYAVDLRFGATVDTANIPPFPMPGTYVHTPVLTTLDVGDTNLYQYTRTASQSVAVQGPERIKSLRVRLSVRSREGDRETDVPSSLLPVTLQNSTPGAGGIYRYQLSNGTFARVRTLQSEISLLNQAEVFW
jgi:hypothetical protein